VSAARLVAPFAGWACALDTVPDPVFAERMMGDGIAIDPLEGLLRAPCDAQVISVAPTRHAVTLRLANGAELLIHIGLETVGLGGAGFEAETRDGAMVREGDPLIRFDLDAVALRARSLVTPMVVANEGFVITILAVDRAVAPGDALLEVAAVTPVTAAGPVGDDTARRDIIVSLAHGIHARPAARIGAALKPFDAEIRFAAHGREANARSPVALMALGLKHGDALAIAGRGRDARAAVSAVATLVESGMGERGDAPPLAAEIVAPPSAGPIFNGIRAAPGFAVGPIFQFRASDADIEERGWGIAHETTALDTSLAALAAELDTVGHTPAAGIVAAHRALLDDPELIAAARARIAEGKSAAFAWREATRDHADMIRATGDPLLIERVADLIDVERRVIAKLTGSAPVLPVPPAGAILVADELLPSEFLAIDARRLAGIVTARGGPTSHVAILAASAGVPMIVATGPGVLALSGEAVLDADAGLLDGDPAPAVLDRARERVKGESARRDAEKAAAQQLCTMADGTRIEIFANLASAEEAAQAVALGAEGCGLLRTEFLFLERDTPPSEAEQRETYATIAAALGDRPIIVRTLDIGADKPVPYLPMPPEENPALGQRGVRISLARPELLATQFRAILSAIPAERCMVMIPMIVDGQELARVRAIFDEAARTVRVGARVPLGVMIETPAAALLAAEIAASADFLSVGSNDLTQYALAADRGNPAVAAMSDALHPAVLRLIAETGKGAAAHGRPLGLCGSLASDPGAAALLIGLGVTELSAAPAAIPALKARVRELDLNICRRLAKRALQASSVAEVRALLTETEG
jgi:multiphosphoryl transfer protein